MAKPNPNQRFIISKSPYIYSDPTEKELSARACRSHNEQRKERLEKDNLIKEIWE